MKRTISLQIFFKTHTHHLLPKTFQTFFKLLIGDIRKEMGRDGELLLCLYIYNLVKSSSPSLPFSFLMFPSFVFFSSNFWKTKKKNNIYFFQTFNRKYQKGDGKRCAAAFLFIYITLSKAAAYLFRSRSWCFRLSF